MAISVPDKSSFKSSTWSAWGAASSTIDKLFSFLLQSWVLWLNLWQISHHKFPHSSHDCIHHTLLSPFILFGMTGFLFLIAFMLTLPWHTLPSGNWLLQIAVKYQWGITESLVNPGSLICPPLANTIMCTQGFPLHWGTPQLHFQSRTVVTHFGYSYTIHVCIRCMTTHHTFKCCLHLLNLTAVFVHVDIFIRLLHQLHPPSGHPQCLYINLEI